MEILITTIIFIIITLGYFQLRKKIRISRIPLLDGGYCGMAIFYLAQVIIICITFYSGNKAYTGDAIAIGFLWIISPLFVFLGAIVGFIIKKCISIVKKTKAQKGKSEGSDLNGLLPK